MAPKAVPLPPAKLSKDPMDFFPFRGQYEGSAAGALLFIAVRSLIPITYYAVLAPPTSLYSIFFSYPSLFPSHPPPVTNLYIPFFPSAIIEYFSKVLGLSPDATLIFAYGTIPSFLFVAYYLLWRREKLPLTGQGGSFQLTTQINLTDVIHAVLYVYTASRNPTWSPRLFSLTFPPFLIGLTLQAVSEHQKYLFRKDKKNEGKVLRSGIWGFVRHPNFLGFTIWRVAFGTAAGGWGFGLMLVVMFGCLFTMTSIPILEKYMERYGAEWDATKEKVKSKMIPGVW
jgi:protein-S-isoprenylcysteine O-methyltransferase Ste14